MQKVVIVRTRERAVLSIICLIVCLTSFTLAQDADKILKDGRTALEHGVYLIAQQQFEEYLANHAADLKAKDYEEVIVYLFRSLYEQRKLTEMTEAISKVQHKRLTDEGMVSFWEILIQYENGQYEKALDEINRFEKKYPTSKYLDRVKRLCAWCYVKHGDIDEALTAFEAFDKEFGDTSDSAENLLEWSKALMSADKPERAAEVLNRLVRISGDLRPVDEGRLLLGGLYIERANYKQAVTVLDELANSENAIADIRAEALYAVASAQCSMTNISAAVAAVTKGMELAQAPRLKSVGTLQLGQVYLNGGDLDRGVALLKKFISEFPDDPVSSEAQLQLANAILDTEKYDLAVNEFQYYIETFTNVTGLARAYYGRGWGLNSIGRHSEAAIEFLKAHDMLQDQTMKERALFKAGDAYFQNGQHKLACESYQRLLKDYPKTIMAAEATFQLGESFARSKKYEDAEKIFRDLVASHSESILAEEALLRLAEIKVEQGLLRDALTLYSNLMNLNSEGTFMPDALSGRGKIYFQQWRFNKALSDFERIVNDFPASDLVEEAYYKRGMCHYWLGQDETTLNVYNAFIQKYPESHLTPSVFFWMGRYYFNHSDFKNANKAFDDFVRKYKEHSLADDAVLWKGYSLIRLREFVKAIETFAMMAKEYPKSPKMTDARFAQGEALCEIANYDAAILIFGEIINKYPESSFVVSSWLRKGDCQFILGGDDEVRYKESMSSYRVVMNNSGARSDQILEAEYKSARSLEKMGRTAEAFAYYYKKILLRMIEEKDKGMRHNESSRLWMTRSALAASNIAEDKEDYKAAVSILELMLSIGGEAIPEAKNRIEKIKSEHWWLFY